MFSNKVINIKKEDGAHTKSDINDTPLIINQSQDF